MKLCIGAYLRGCAVMRHVWAWFESAVIAAVALLYLGSAFNVPWNQTLFVETCIEAGLLAIAYRLWVAREQLKARA